MGVRMRHPESGGEYDAQPSQVPHLVEAGWQVMPGQAVEGEIWPTEAQRFGGQDQVRIRHPETGGETVVAASSVPYHRERGWDMVSEESASGEAAQPEDRLEEMTAEELKDYARRAGLPVSGTKAELVERLRAAPAVQEPAEPAEPTEEG
jgi:hypothetical protein